MKEFSIVRKGYAPEEVNAYIAELEAALADKVSRLLEYQDKESAITSSLVDAQIFSAQIRKAAEDEAETLRAGAKEEAETLRASALDEAQNLRASAYDEMDQLREQAGSLHEKLTAFQTEYSRILQDYLVSLRSTDLVNLFSRLESFMQTISVSKTEEAPAEEVAGEVAEEVCTQNCAACQTPCEAYDAAAVLEEVPVIIDDAIDASADDAAAIVEDAAAAIDEAAAAVDEAAAAFEEFKPIFE